MIEEDEHGDFIMSAATTYARQWQSNEREVADRFSNFHTALSSADTHCLRAMHDVMSFIESLGDPAQHSTAEKLSEVPTQ